VPGLSDDSCSGLKCKDGNRCGGVDKDGLGMHYSTFIIDNPDPRTPTSQLTQGARLALQVTKSKIGPIISELTYILHVLLVIEQINDRYL
jgi:hypothetical protein